MAAKKTAAPAVATTVAPAAPAIPDTAQILAMLQAAGIIPAAAAAPAKAAKAAKAAAPADASMKIDFGKLRQTGASRPSSSGKTILLPVMGKDGDVTFGGTLWVKVGK